MELTFRRAIRAGLTVLLASGLCAGAAPAATPTITEFTNGILFDAGPKAITAGPDGNLWFGFNPEQTVGRITPDGTVMQFNIPGGGFASEGITAGSDGNLWYSDYNGKKIGRVTPTGTITTFPVDRAPTGIADGPDKSIWFVGNENPQPNPQGTAKIVNRTFAGVITEFPLAGVTNPLALVVGSDGNLWFTDDGGSQVGRVTPSGTLTLFPRGGSTFPTGIAAGPDGNIWFTERAANTIVRMTPTGDATTFTVPTAASSPRGIAAGPDGNLWFVEQDGNKIGRITPRLGTITEFPLPNAGSKPQRITAGPDGNLWFSEQGTTSRIGRITTAVDPPQYTNSDKINVLDNAVANPYPSTINVAGAQGKVTDVSVRLNGLHHSFPADLNVLLVAPGGQKVLLMAASGGGTPVVGPVMTFSDAGVLSPAVLSTGTFKPFPATLNPTFPAPAPGGPYEDTLSVLDGIDPNGDWKLFVRDDSGGDIGVIASGWSLSLKTTGPPVEVPVPGPTVQVPVPGPTVEVPGPTVEVPGPTVEVPGPTVEVPGPTVQVPGPTVQVPAAPDETKPTVGVTGLALKPKLAVFRKGVGFTVTPSERVTLDISLLHASSGAVLAELERTLTSTAGVKLSVKPNARRLGKPKKSFKVTLRITATDRGGNRTKLSRTITVRPDKTATKRR
jgi:streptogramin lyase